MAAGTISKMRIIWPNDMEANWDFCPTIEKLKTKNYNDVLLIVCEYEAAFPNGYAETSAPNAVFDGTSTAATVFVVSSDAKDDIAGVGVQKVRLYGIDSTGVFAYEDISMAGTTDVQTTTLWKRIFHCSAIQWGSENDAAGTIIVESDAVATATYLTIGAGANESDGLAFWVPQTYKIAIAGLSFVMTTSANANAALLVKVHYNNFDTTGADPDFQNEQFRTTVNGNGHMEIFNALCWHTASGLSKVLISDTYKGAAETGHFKIAFVVYKPTTRGSTVTLSG